MSIKGNPGNPGFQAFGGTSSISGGTLLILH